jgi:predicted metal-dependent hydrolase
VEYPESYLVGIKLFNDGHFWHAHEAWEDVWKATEDPSLRLYFKGIIQTAAALVHWQRGNPRGLHLNWHKARPKLQGLPEVVLGVRLTPLIVAMDRFEAAQGAGLAPPRIEIRD